MKLPVSDEQRARVEAFRRKHRTALLTMVFTDLVGSTALKRRLGDVPGVEWMWRHDAILREVLRETHDSEEISSAGDSFFLVFLRPSDAVRFGLRLQAALRAEPPREGMVLRDRVGIHLGEVIVLRSGNEGEGRDFFGIQVDLCARLMSLGQADQILLTRTVFDNARQVLKGDQTVKESTLSWLSHGRYILSGLDEPVEVCEVGEVGKAALCRPLKSEKGAPESGTNDEAVLGWRPAVGECIPDTRWRLVARLGEGGFGEVWHVVHRELGENGVLKFCFRADRVRSLKRELKVFQLLRERFGGHPNIVGIREVQLESAPYYLVMDFSDGQDLKSWIRAQGGFDSVPIAVRFEVVAQIADALQAVHEAGVLHRDVKPSNIIVVGGRHDSHAPDNSLRAQLTDFGVGMIVVPPLPESGPTRPTFEVTTGASTGGTALYQAPEIFAGQPASTRSDIYSLGVVLYQLASADFDQPITIDWARRINDPLLREVLASCLAGDLQERFAGAGQLARQLRSLEARRQDAVDQEVTLRRRERDAFFRGLLVTAIVSVPCLSLFLWWLWLNLPPPPLPPSRTEVGRGPNAMTFYLAATSVLDAESIEEARTKVAPANPADLLRHALSRNKTALVVAKIGYDYPCYRLPQDGSGINTNLAGLGRLSELLVIETQLAEAEGRWEDACDGDLRLIRMGYDLAVGSPLLDTMVGWIILARGTARLANVIPHLDSVAARHAGKELDEIRHRGFGFFQVLEAEKHATGLEIRRRFKASNWRMDVMLESERIFGGPAMAEEVWTEKLALFLKTFPLSKRGTLRAVDAYHDAWLDLIKGGYRPNFDAPTLVSSVLAERLAFTGLESVYLRHLFVETQMALLQVELALRECEAETGALPATTEDLMPRFLSAIPADPFLPGRPIIYRRDGGRYRLYGVGPDGIDDNGKLPSDGRYLEFGRTYQGDLGLLRRLP
ncbi:MAG: protein kinase [Verrucomicrobiales bacterium]|nr:protein kinase [Verrucomicrobiales bacterium]